MAVNTNGEAVEHKLPEETLKIRNFLSICKLDCEFAQFNVITGEMGSGKSLAIKLLKYFQDVISRFFFYPVDDFWKYLDISEYRKELKRKFYYIFVLDASNPPTSLPFEIDYTFSCGKNTFSMTIKGKNSEITLIESSYLENLLKNWKEQFTSHTMRALDNQPNPDGFKEFRHTLYDAIQVEFNQRFPILTAFTPASRATLAYCDKISDYFLNKYTELVDTMKKQTDNPEYANIISEILKAKIKIEEDDSISLVLSDDRKVPLKNASSGQQEIVYILMQLSKLHKNSLYYGKVRSLFIEEPEAQLYPNEQMKIINFIVRVYNDQKKSGIPVRFFITTHSPYVLNSLNNILTKGSLLENYPEQEEKIKQEVSDDDLSFLTACDVSAYHISIKNDNKSISDSMMDDNLIYPEKISDISSKINKFDAKLSRLKNELLGEKE